MIMIVLCTLFFSLAHQVKNRILLERYEYGVLLAMGCDDWRLLFRAARQSLLGALLGIPIALALLLWLLSSAGWLSAFKITPEPMLMLLAACLIVLLVVLAAIPPVLSLLPRQIYPLLRTL
jgi:ABC-type antimicrobial peptide transport system permease subunit